MLIGYVSDERYVALAEVLLEFESKAGRVAVRSHASGAIDADLPAGAYRVTLARPGYGSKRVEITLPQAAPHQFRLLKDDLLGYMWPKVLRPGGKAGVR